MNSMVIFLICLVNLAFTPVIYDIHEEVDIDTSITEDYEDANIDLSITEYDLDLTGEESEKLNDFKYTKEYVEENMPKTYSITYDSSMSETMEIISLTVTDEGYYGINGEHESLYIKNENGTYYSYNKHQGDIFTAVPIEHDADTIEAWTGSIKGHFTSYQYGPQNYELVGTEKVAGIECEVYTDSSLSDVNLSGEGLSEYDSIYYIEPKTGICLKYVNGRHEYEFECTEFKTENLSLPEYE